MFHHGTLILPDRTVDDGVVVCEEGRISAVGRRDEVAVPAGAATVDAAGGYISRGFVDIHSHGAGGADFMDGTPAAVTAASKDRRPALDRLTADVRRHKVEAVVCWKLDRLGRNLRHLVLLLDEWQARGIEFVTLGEGIDTSTAAGRLVAGVLGAIAEFERARVQERIHAGLRRARAQGKRLGRRQGAAARRLPECDGLSHAAAAERLGVSEATVKRWRRKARQGSESVSSAA